MKRRNIPDDAVRVVRKFNLQNLDMNVIPCKCGKQWRFRGVKSGLLVYEKRWMTWRVWNGQPNPWPSTITKFICKCGQNLAPREH